MPNLVCDRAERRDAIDTETRFATAGRIDRFVAADERWRVVSRHAGPN